MLTGSLAAEHEYAEHFMVGSVECYQATFEALANSLESPSTLLSEEETRRSCAYSFAADAERYTLSHAFLRLVLARALFPHHDAPALHQNAKELTIRQSVYGKPFVAASETLPPAFSLSRSDQSTAVVLGWNVELGIDVESLASRRHMTPELMRYTFSKNELHHLGGLIPSEEDALKLWTRKEAILKADGRGLRIPPMRVETALTRVEPLALPAELGVPSNWAVHTKVRVSEVVSVAIRR